MSKEMNLQKKKKVKIMNELGGKQSHIQLNELCENKLIIQNKIKESCIKKNHIQIINPTGKTYVLK